MVPRLSGGSVMVKAQTKHHWTQTMKRSALPGGVGESLLEDESDFFPRGGIHGGRVSGIEGHSNQRKQSAQKASGI